MVLPLSKSLKTIGDYELNLDEHLQPQKHSRALEVFLAAESIFGINLPTLKSVSRFIRKIKCMVLCKKMKEQKKKKNVRRNSPLLNKKK